MNPEDLRKEAASAEFMAKVVSYLPDRQWLTAKAAELRRLAERIEARSWDPQSPSDTPPSSGQQ